VRKRKDTWYKSLEFQVSGVLEKLEALQRNLDLTMQVEIMI
jgi:hypothetical protein